MQRSASRGQTPATLDMVARAITTCERCPRLRNYCKEVARTRKTAFKDQQYWGRPVPGFGDPNARILILGLAPAAHGANRTGRVFTGDGVGASGDFLMAALKRAGYSNIPTSQAVDDGLKLKDVYIAAAVRCAPPQNKPTPEEIDTCLDHLRNEVAMLPNLEIVVALGKIAWDAWLKLAGVRPRPAFGHNARVRTPAPRHPGTLALVGCFHPSRQNTNTGKVTPVMYDRVFQHL